MVGQHSEEEAIYENSVGGAGGSLLAPVPGLRWIDMQNYRDPPPYPGHSKQHPAAQQQQMFSTQPGYRQSYSGSETSTDVSLSSTENLATSQRQDPQGEETRPSGYSTIDHMAGGGMFDGGGGSLGGGYSILERLGMPPSILADNAGKFSSLNNTQQQPSSPGPQQSSSSSYSTYVQERIRRQEEFLKNGSNSGSSTTHNHQSVGGYSASSVPSGYTPSALYSGGSAHQQTSSSPLYSRGNLTVPHQHWQSSSHSSSSLSRQSPGLHNTPSSPHYMTTSSASARHESSISSNSSSSSTLTMISRGGGGGGGSSTGNFSSSMISYSSSTTNRSSSSSNHIKNNNINTIGVDNVRNDNSGGYTPRQGTPLSSSSSSSLPPHPPSSLSSSSSSPSVPVSSSPSSSISPSSVSKYHQQYNIVSPRVPPVSTYHHPHPYVNQHWTMGSGDSTSSGSMSSLVTASSSTSSSRLDLLNSGNGAALSATAQPGLGNNASNASTSISNNNAPSYGASLPPPHPGSSTSSGNIRASSSATSLSHLPSYNAQATRGMGSLPPPPEYPGNKASHEPTTPRSFYTSSSGGYSLASSSDNLRPSKSFENMRSGAGQGSQGDLRGQGRGSQHDLRPSSASPGIYGQDLNKITSVSRSAGSSATSNQMVEILTEQNRTLREELAAAAVKVAKLHKLEQEIQKVHDSHTALVQSSQKREGLWMAMKRKLEERIQSLELQQRSGNVENGAASIGSTTSTLSATGADTELRIKLAEKDAMISKLLSQNQELSSARDQLDATNAQNSLSLAEQRAHVDILENALLNAQSRVLTLEEETRKKSANTEKIEQLQKALASLQLASEKQEKKEKEMRARLEKELQGYRLLEKQTPRLRGEPSKDDSKSAGMLRKILDEKDARILTLETEIAGMEQRYVKETTLRQLNMESSTSEAPKEVRLAALEKSSSDMERLIDEAKTEKLKHMEELHQSHRKVAELEARVKQLQTQVVEKEAMLKVFQRSPLAMARSSSLHALCHHSNHSASSVAHSPRPSLISSGGAWGSSSGYASSRSCGAGAESSPSSVASSIRHMKTGSASAIELGRKMSIEEDLLSKVQNFRTESKSDSEEEVKLWHV